VGYYNYSNKKYGEILMLAWGRLLPEEILMLRLEGLSEGHAV
jgi:hypothetical protein